MARRKRGRTRSGVAPLALRKNVEIVGAGPAGLSAALAARTGGAEVIVHEKRPDVGARFHGDFQGLENWTTEVDVLSELKGFGIDTTFEYTSVYEIVCYDPCGIRYEAQASDPIFYLVRRGGDPGTLDHALKSQALDAGVIIRFGSRQLHVSGTAIVAEGPHRADVIAGGYVFETEMPDGCYVAIANRLAPAGYSYLLIANGRGTVATCLFDDFHEERRYLEETVAFFERKIGLRWDRATRFGGSGNYDRVHRVIIGDRSYAGEAAGFQDALFGFGLRYALTSGHLAGRAAAVQTNYEDRWRSGLGGLNSASIFNRWLYARLGDHGRKTVLRCAVAGRDPRRLLRRIYAPSRWKRVLAGCLSRKPLLTATRVRDDCDCTWCRCHRDAHAS